MYKPLPDCITIKKSPIHGLGLFATRWISKGRDLGIILYPHPFLNNEYLRSPMGGFGNHSDDPNCEKFEDTSGNWWIRTIKEVEPDDEITWAYTLYEVYKPIVP